MHSLIDINPTYLEEMFDNTLKCQVDHSKVEALTNLSLPTCAIEAGAEAIDCMDRFYVCAPLAKYIETNLNARLMRCKNHGFRCIRLRWL